MTLGQRPLKRILVNLRPAPYLSDQRNDVGLGNMTRIIVLVLAIVAVVLAANALGRAVQTTREATLPDTVKTVSYVLLIILMLGVVTGWLGGL